MADATFIAENQVLTERVSTAAYGGAVFIGPEPSSLHASASLFVSIANCEFVGNQVALRSLGRNVSYGPSLGGGAVALETGIRLVFEINNSTFFVRTGVAPLGTVLTQSF